MEDETIKTLRNLCYCIDSLESQMTNDHSLLGVRSAVRFVELLEFRDRARAIVLEQPVSYSLFEQTP